MSDLRPRRSALLSQTARSARHVLSRHTHHAVLGVLAAWVLGMSALGFLSLHLANLPNDKLLHGGAFAGLCVLVYALPRRLRCVCRTPGPRCVRRPCRDGDEDDGGSLLCPPDRLGRVPTRMLLATALCGFLALASEYAQGVVNPARTFDPEDILANLVLGLAIALAGNAAMDRILPPARPVSPRANSSSTDLELTLHNDGNGNGNGDAMRHSS
ncbi:hypothetical protein H9P43_005950 [Blastocladiella emersonii ATCC 22665]|nr:hypothetical protein H9P43_005950 [Blastocladiella emersonii ATCC 22665]